MKLNKQNLVWGLIVAGVLSRWLPHPPNVTAVAASALFAGMAVHSRWQALFVPLIVLFLSDLVLGFHTSMWAVYLAMLVPVVLGYRLKSDFSWGRLTSYSLVSSLSFFLLTNFAVWLAEGLYSHSLQGLQQCYVMALPFFGYETLGDLFFSGVLFGLWKVIPEAKTVTA